MTFIYNFQTLISGILAIGAAGIGACVLWRSAQLPLEEQRRREIDLLVGKRLFLSSLLNVEFRILTDRARQAESTIDVTIATDSDVTDNTREKTILKLPAVIDNWELMAAIPVNLLQALSEFRKLVDDHNFDMNRAGGAFGADNFRRSIKQRVKLIAQQAAQLANQFAGLK